MRPNCRLVTRFANISVYENPGCAAASAPLEPVPGCRQPGGRRRNCWPVRLFHHHGNAVVELRKGWTPELEELFGVVGTERFVANSSFEISTEPSDRDRVRIVRYENDRVDVVADSNHPRLLVLADVLTEGWKAYLGERELPIHYANYAFRGVFLPPGSNEVSFRFRPFDADVALNRPAEGLLRSRRKPGSDSIPVTDPVDAARRSGGRHWCRYVPETTAGANFRR